MSTTHDRLHTAYFPGEYADIVMEVLAIRPANFLSIKDAFYHFRQLDDGQAAEVMEHIADRIDSAISHLAPRLSQSMMLDTELPPDPERMNGRRAAWAGRAVAEFQHATGTDDEDALSDLLADLMHWADRNNYDFDAALLRGRDHYAAETAAEEA